MYEIMVTKLEDCDLLNTLYRDIFIAIILLIAVIINVTRTETYIGMDLEADDHVLKSCILKELMAAIAARLEKHTVLWQDLFKDFTQRDLEPPPTYIASMTTQQSRFQSVPLLKKVFDFIEANYNRLITLNDVAEAVGYSPAYLTNLVRQQTGQSLYRWITSRRMAQACFLLLETDQTVNQIATSLSYQSLASFRRQFRQSYGKNPQMWRTESRDCFKSL